MTRTRNRSHSIHRKANPHMTDLRLQERKAVVKEAAGLSPAPRWVETGRHNGRGPALGRHRQDLQAAVVELGVVPTAIASRCTEGDLVSIRRPRGMCGTFVECELSQP